MPMWRMPSGIGSTPGTTAGAAQKKTEPSKISSLCFQEALHGSRVFRNPAGIRLGEGIHQWWVVMIWINQNVPRKLKLTNDNPILGNVPYFWTSGRLCDFDGCDRPDFFPKNINGWFWSANQARLSPTNGSAFHDWSGTGGFSPPRPQPDNREQIQQVAYFSLN